MAEIEPLWEDFGYTWDDWASHAHEFGAGPVTVTAKESWMLPAVAEAVRRWNQAIGTAVFKLDKEDPEADVVVKLAPIKPGTTADANPLNDIVRVNEWHFPEKPLPVDQYAQAILRGTLVHELGHIAGLGHPETRFTGETGYGDPRLIMSDSSRGVPAGVESQAVGGILGPVANSPNRLERERQHIEREERVNKLADDSAQQRDYNRAQL